MLAKRLPLSESFRDKVEKKLVTRCDEQGTSSDAGQFWRVELAASAAGRRALTSNTDE
jgi:hypothetical protein